MKRECRCCRGSGAMLYADSFDRDNGEPCSWCNPAGLASRHGGTMGKIDITPCFAGATSRSIKVKYACGCVAWAVANGHLVGKPISVPTMCEKHGERLASFSETVKTGFKLFPKR